MQAKPKGPSKTTPKHGKDPVNRLYTTFRRGSTKKAENDGGINPDGSIEVAAVCGGVVRIYDTVKHKRRRLDELYFPNHGAAVLFATEHDESQRAMRARAS